MPAVTEQPKVSNLTKRLITGPLLVLLLVGVILADTATEHITRPGLPLFCLAVIWAIFGASEITAIIRGHGLRGETWLTAAAVLTALSLGYLMPDSVDGTNALALGGTALVLFMVLGLIVFSRGHVTEGVMPATAALLMAMVHLGVLMSFLLAIRVRDGAWVLVAVILITKAGDSGAYFTGRAIGRRKLIPWLSPGKTWEGLFGGIAAAMAGGAFLAWVGQRWMGTEYSIGLGLIAGFLFLIVGQAGDLIMSLLKRGAGVKDSSSLLPGLGGALDVLDSPLLVGPVAWWVLAT